MMRILNNCMLFLLFWDFVIVYDLPGTGILRIIKRLIHFRAFCNLLAYQVTLFKTGVIRHLSKFAQCLQLKNKTAFQFFTYFIILHDWSELNFLSITRGMSEKKS